MPKDLGYYLSLDYPIELTREDGIYVASHPDLPGCVSQGNSADEAVANLDDAREAWLTVRVEDKLFIGEPVSEEYSGRLSLRMTSSLHASLATAAQREGVSLNSYIVTTIAEVHGAREIVAKAEEQFTAIRTYVESSLTSLSTAASYGLQRALPAGERLANRQELAGNWRPASQGLIGSLGRGEVKA